MEAFEELEVWKRSARLSANVFRALETSRVSGFRDQVFRSALSVPSNIAEGYERGSRREYIRFLNIAKGSCAELRTQIYIGIETGIMGGGCAAEYIKGTCEISKMLQGLINSLRITED